ncbi:MAG: hypothetical protein WCG03_11195 [Kiritimatiellales bacterium]
MYKRRILFLLVVSCCLFLRAEAKSAPDWVYLDNGTVRIGVDKSRGACVGYFGESKTRRNLLNHYDEGRFVQQSYYGDSDGSMWNKQPWSYNPVQGGSWDRKPSRMLEFRKTDDSLYAQIEPRSWSGGAPCPEAIMEETITLKDSVARITFKMTYTGEDQGNPRHQEMPAVFVDGALKNFFYEKNGIFTNEAPRILGEGGKKGTEGLGLGASTSEWVAYLDDNGWGIGVFTPGTTDFTVYRALGNGTTGPEGSACSYVAPLRTFSLTKDRVVEYDVFLTVGTLDEISNRFKELKNESRR